MPLRSPCLWYPAPCPRPLERIADRLTYWHNGSMPRGYSRDLRERLLQAVASGVSMVEIERTTDVSARSISRWKHKHQAHESLEPGIPSGRPRKIAPEDEELLRVQVMATPDATLAEHCAEWATSGHATVSPSTMCRMLARLQLPLKKDPDCHGTGRGRPNPMASRDGGDRSGDGAVSG
jgi:transposase